MRSNRPIPVVFILAIGAGMCMLGAGIAYNIPAVNDRLYPRIDALTGRVRSLFSNQADTLPTPSGEIAAPPTFVIDTATPTLAPTKTQMPATAQATVAPTATSNLVLDLPASMMLEGARYEPQLYNNCAPATLTAGLTFWGWQGAIADEPEWYASGQDVRWQRDIAAVVKPVQGDKNVMPYELANYATDRVGLGALIRYGGDLDTIRRFIANGYPVIIERGFRQEERNDDEGWQGHYGLVAGYDDNKGEFTLQDSYKGKNYRRAYDLILRDWRDFNYIYIILYPADSEADVLALLGEDADPAANYNRALAKAQTEALSVTNPESLAFAWFNIGTSLQLLGRNTEAAAAFDQARSYGTLPWRMLWYQTEMYKAYFYSERYQDVISLASVTLKTPGLEESFYWRGWAYYQLRDYDRATADMRAALNTHPNWDQALNVLASWGVSP